MRQLPLPSCDPRAPWSRPLELADHGGLVGTLDVADGEVVAVVVEEQVRSVLLPARHCVHVLAPGESAGDLLPRDLAARASVAEAELRPWLNRLRHLPAEGQLLRLDTRPLPAMAWRASGHGWWRGHVHSPSRFYDSFLRNTENLTCDRFAPITEAVVSEAIARENDPAEGGDLEDLARRAARSLGELGMRLEEFELVARSSEETGADSPMRRAPSPSLATNCPSG